MTPYQAYRSLFPRHMINHCIDRLMERGEFSNRDKAESTYFRHHGMLLTEGAVALYRKFNPETDKQVATIYRLIDRNGSVYYPVRVDHEPTNRITVTYLDAEMVVRNMMSIYVLEQKAMGCYPIQEPIFADD